MVERLRGGGVRWVRGEGDNIVLTNRKVDVRVLFGCLPYKFLRNRLGSKICCIWGCGAGIYIFHIRPGWEKLGIRRANELLLLTVLVEGDILEDIAPIR
jgi:hypothetical protein